MLLKDYDLQRQTFTGMMLISSGNHPKWRQVSAIFSLVNGFISARFNEWNIWDMDGM